VWHASAAPFPGLLALPSQCERLAYGALNGVGDPITGEWTEWTGKAFHVRRRLTVREEESVGPVVDVRGTTEVARRLAHIPRVLGISIEEFGVMTGES
jgi:hypothetical protein